MATKMTVDMDEDNVKIEEAARLQLQRQVDVILTRWRRRMLLWQNEDNADTIVTMATMMTVDTHIHGYNDKDNVEIDAVARRQRTRQC